MGPRLGVSQAPANLSPVSRSIVAPAIPERFAGAIPLAAGIPASNGLPRSTTA
jgi:hypothetical protein